MDETTLEKFLNAVVILGICGMSLYWAQALWKISNDPITKIEIQYDCRLAEISVDYPQEIKQRCRKLLAPQARVVIADE